MPTGVYKRTEEHKKHLRESMSKYYTPLSEKEKKDKLHRKYLKYREYFLEKTKRYRKSTPEIWARTLERGRNNRYKYKIEALRYYSGGNPHCNCCKENMVEFLTIDHIVPLNGKPRETIRAGSHMYLWLRRNNYPPGYQVLCFNCNYGKRNKLSCPHKTNLVNNYSEDDLIREPIYE